jgi:ZIP family zinc transporter
MLAVLIILAVYLVEAHPGHSHGDAESTSSPDTSSSDIQSRALYAWSLSLFALVGTLIGALVPVVSHYLEKTKYKHMTIGPTMVSGAFAFSSGVLLYGSLALIMPGSISLLYPIIGKPSSMLVFALWVAGIGVVWCFKLLGTLLGHEHSHGQPAQVVDPEDLNQDKKPLPELKNVSVATALVLALHKIPEGIVMFASAVANPQFGAFVALSLMVHNIPEALAISVPMHAAGFWLRGFVYAMAVGVMQPIGAGLGYLLVSTVGFLTWHRVSFTHRYLVC